MTGRYRIEQRRHIFAVLLSFSCPTRKVTIVQPLINRSFFQMNTSFEFSRPLRIKGKDFSQSRRDGRPAFFLFLTQVKEQGSEAGIIPSID
jgi:hypothetical protein